MRERRRRSRLGGREVPPRCHQARLPLLALVAYPVGGLLGGVVHLDALGPGAAGYLAVLAALAVIPTVVWIWTP